jgi:hypothetical protein
MQAWFKRFFNSRSQTKYFVLNWVLYFVLMVVTTAICYARLDFVRGYRKVSQEQSKTGP